jgi:hypothetical protein
MGTTLTYRHEDGINYNYVLPDLIVGSCLQGPEDVDRLQAAGVTTVFSLQVRRYRCRRLKPHKSSLNNSAAACGIWSALVCTYCLHNTGGESLSVVPAAVAQACRRGLLLASLQAWCVYSVIYTQNERCCCPACRRTVTWSTLA